jgi:FkbM family methyltransferase
MITATSDAPEVELVWRFFEERREGYFVDVGANEPKFKSQTWPLEEAGWRGVLVEPLPDLAERLRRERPNSKVFQAACGAPGHAAEMTFHVSEGASKSSLAPYRIGEETKYVGTQQVRVLTLDEILAEAALPRVDFISIDVEGTQLDVLRGLDLKRHQPALLLVEDHLFDLESHRHMTRNNYRLVKRTGLNNWYVPSGRPFPFSTVADRMRLWKRIWLNTPFRKFRMFLERRRARAERTAKVVLIVLALAGIGASGRGSGDWGTGARGLGGVLAVQS